MSQRCVAVALIGAVLAGLTAVPAGAQGPSEVAGTYCLAGVREVGSCFRLEPDQRFEYFFSYGAYDETSEGRWRLDGNDVILESPTFDRKSRFIFKERRAAPGDRFTLIVENADGRGLAGVDVRVRCDGATTEGYTQTYGYALACRSAPEALALGVRMVGLAHQSVTLPEGGGSGKALVFTFDPGDLGRKAFPGTRLARDGDGLSLTFESPAIPELNGRRLTYRRR